jgi:dTMP kinase
MSERGLFITVEGCEGAGKSTAIEFLTRSLQDAGVEFVRTREPGGTRLGEALRTLLLRPDDTSIEPLAELLLMFAARAQHLKETVLPALHSGRWVLCDRFTDATYAYQGAGRRLGERAVAVLEDLVQGELRPDVTVLLDVPVATGLARARGRGALDRFEREDLEFFERVREAYLSLAARGSGRYRVIDGAQELPDVQAALSELLQDLLACPAVLEDR